MQDSGFQTISDSKDSRNPKRMQQNGGDHAVVRQQQRALDWGSDGRSILRRMSQPDEGPEVEVSLRWERIMIRVSEGRVGGETEEVFARDIDSDPCFYSEWE